MSCNNGESRGICNTNSQIKFKTTMLRSSLCIFSHEDIRAKGTITVNNTAAADTAANNANKKVIFKNCTPFTDCISKINNVKIDHANTDITMRMYHLIEYLEVYSNTIKTYQLKVTMVICFI